MDNSEEDRRIIDATLTLVERSGWNAVGLAAIAEESGVPLVDLRRRFSSKTDILRHLIRLVDDQVLAQGPVSADESETPRDRLFEILMRRFDALRPFQVGLRAVFRDIRSRPLVVALLGEAVSRSMGWMRVAARLDRGGARDFVATMGLTALYASVFRVWLQDDTPDLSRTMAALDRALRRGEEVRDLCRRGPIRRHAAPEPAPPPGTAAPPV